MRWWSRFAGGLAALVRRPRIDAELSEELQGFFAASVQAKVDAGMSRADAERAARSELGSVPAVKDWVRDAGWESRLENAWYDVRYALRFLRRSPAFTIVAVLTLALGTGANAAIFQLLNAVRFQPLPVQKPGELVSIGLERHGKGRVGIGYRGGVHTLQIWETLQTEQQAFSALLAWGTDTWDLSAAGESVPATGLYVSGGYFSALGIAPHLGRVFTSADDRKGCTAPGVVLSHSAWISRYGGDPLVVGRSITVNHRSLEVVGVTPPGFFGVEVGRGFDLAVPLCAEPLFRGQRAASTARAGWWLNVMGRLKPGWTVAQAASHLAAISPGLFASTLPASYPAEAATAYRAFTLTADEGATGVSTLRTQYGTHLWFLFAGTGLVLLITCANLANLMLARATARDREVAIRLAIGGSRWRIVRQMFTESVLIAAAGVVSGFLLARWLSETLVTLLSGENSRILLDLSPDWRVFAFIAGMASIACLLFGLSPALRVTGTNPGEALQPDGRSGTDGQSALTMRRVLVVAQVAICVVLVVAAVLFARSLRNLGSINLGFDPHVVAAHIDLNRISAPADARATVLADVLQRVRAVPGVAYASEALIVPLSGPEWNGRIAVQGRLQEGPAYFNAVGGDYFRVLGMPLVAGRSFEGRDSLQAPRVAVVNQAFVRRFLPAANAVGQVFEVEGAPNAPRERVEIIGLVGDGKFRDVREESLPIAHLSMAQEPGTPDLLAVMVRTDLPTASITAPLTQAITGAAPGASVSYDTIEEYIRALVRTDRLMTSLTAAFGILALIISVVGVYGVMSYVVTRRQVEIGIRMALGADRGRVVRMMLGESATLLGAGAAIGLVLAVTSSRYAAKLLYGVTPLDPMSFVVATAVLIVVGVLAAWVPARRASRLPPTLAIRQ